MFAKRFVRGFTSTNLPCSIIPYEIVALSISTQLGSDEITGLLGKGGMGVVYKPKQHEVDGPDDVQTDAQVH